MAKLTRVGESSSNYVDNIAELRKFTPVRDGQTVIVGEHSAGTGLGGGRFRSKMNYNVADNNGTIIRSGSHAWLRVGAEVTNPLMFGAVGNTNVDSSSAIHKAIAAAQSRCDGLGMSYGVGTTISLNDNDREFHSAKLVYLPALGGNPLMRLRAKNPNVHHLTFDGNNKQSRWGIIWEGALTDVGGVVEDCQFWYMGWGGVSVSCDYANDKAASYGKIRRCLLVECGHNGEANGRCSILADGVSHFTIEDIDIKKCNWGIYVRQDTNLAGRPRREGNVVSDCRIQGCGRDVFLDAQGLSAPRQNGMKVHNMIIWDFADNGFDFGSSTGCQITNFRATNCKDAIFLGNISCERYVIDNVIALNCDRLLRVVMDGTLYPVEQMSHVHLNNCHAYNCNWQGFYMGNTGAQTSVHKLTLTNCSASGYTGNNFTAGFHLDGITNATLTDCSTDNMREMGIKLKNCDIIQIKGGIHQDVDKRNAGAYAVQAEADCNRLNITDVQVYGAGTSGGAILVGGGVGHQIKHNRWRGVANGLNTGASVNPYLLDNAAF